MKNILCVMFLILFLSGSVCAQELKQFSAEVLTKTSKSWDGADLPNYPEGKPEITIMRAKIPPKGKMPLHKHPFICAGVILKGEITVMTEDGKTFHLKTGDPNIEVVDKWHSVTNDGNETAEIIVFCAGVQGAPFAIPKNPKKP